MTRIVFGKTLCFVIIWYLLVVTMTLYAQPQHHRGRSPFDQMDRNSDGKLSKKEFKGPNRVFTDMDTDNDGNVSKQEMQTFHQKRHGKKQDIDKKKYQGPYPDLIIKKYDKNKTWPGNVIFVDKNRNCIIETSLDGKVVWECAAPKAEVSGTMRRSCGARLTEEHGVSP